MGAIAFPYVVYRYALWHYTRALSDILVLFWNMLWFLWNFFSLSLLAQTLFSPWRRIQERQPSDLTLESIGETVLVNTVMRVVGLFVRLLFILIGTTSLVLSFLALAASLVIWLLLPLIIFSLVITGAASLFAFS